MNNKELLEICYDFFNSFITSKNLIDKLSNIKDNDEVDILIKDIKQIVKSTPNIEDEYVKQKKENIQRIISKMQNIPKSLGYNDFIDKQINNLKDDYNKEMDSYDLWFKIAECINNNDYFNKCFDSLSDYELLELISRHISAPFPPKLSQEDFNKLVKAGIEKDEREWLWRLAFNYENSDIDLNEIASYFIDKKDGYYISELISAVGDKLDIDNMIDRIDDEKLIKDLTSRKDVFSRFLSIEQYNRLINKITSINTDHYILKILEEKQIEKMFNILSDSDVIANLNMQIHKDLKDTKELYNEYMNGLKNKEKYPFEIINKENNDFMGVFLIKRDLYNDDSFEFTIYLDKEYWSKGVYTEVLPYMTKFAFEKIKTKYFRGYVMQKNIASRKVLEKCNFKLEKIFDVPNIEGKIYSYIKENND